MRHGHGHSAVSPRPRGGGFVPPRLSGCALWLRADLGWTVTGSGVSAWLDQSGAGHNASQVTDARRPAYLTAGGVNGHPGVHFSRASTKWMGVHFSRASTKWMDLGVWAETATSWTMVAVYKQLTLPATAATNQYLIASATLYGMMAEYVTGGLSKVGCNDGSNNRVWGAAQLGDQWLEGHFDAAATMSYGYRNGALLGSGAYVPAAFTGQTYIGRYQPYAVYYLDAIVSELIVYSRLLTDAAELLELRAYLSTRYAL